VPGDPLVEHPLDIVISTFGRPSNIEPLIASLDGQVRPDDTVTVVWQGALRPELTKREYCTCIHSAPPNLPLARNRGIGNGKNEVVLFLDDDVRAEPGLLDGHRRAYDNPDIHAVAGSLIDPLFNGSQGVPSILDLKRGECRQDFDVPRSQESASMMGANMSIRRTVLDEVGMFDPNFRHNAWWEDIDMSLRIRTKGLTIWYDAEAKAVHLRESSGGCRNDSNSRYLYHQFANTAYFACKHAPRQYWPGWIRFWKYRLEYYSRSGKTVKGGYTHNVVKVCAGIAGACAGVLRFARYASMAHGKT
jgi:glycosyltransferase involved in cell wall biosynthesis